MVKKRILPNLLLIGETIVAGHKYWFSKQKGSGLQQFVFNQADKLKHGVFVVLQHLDRRLFTSFSDAAIFWDYYSKFKGKRCFYWINRSFEMSKESSLLHFDIEWWTDSRDTHAKAKLFAIRKSFNTALPQNVQILEEDLSRRLSTAKWKNSFHLYAMITLKHNADGCMRPLVTEKIWGNLKNRKDM